MALPRIYFDANSRLADGRYDLGLSECVESMANAAVSFKDGDKVLLYDEDGLELEAILEFDAKYQIWTARA